MTDETEFDALVVGAGIAGLCAARELRRAGLAVLVLDKGRGVGGRMATRRLGSAVCDHGAQFFTVRGRAFGGLVAEAQAVGAVAEWCRGFLGPGSVTDAVAADGHPRWRGRRGMTDLPKHLAALAAADAPPGRCRIRTASRVVAIGARAGRVVVDLEDGGTIAAAGGILTPPVPQSLDMLAAGGLTRSSGEAAAFDALATVAYDPCFAMLAVLAAPSRVPPPGGIQFDPAGGGPIAWIADNHVKGVSPVPALTVHADGAFSRRHFDDPPDDVMGVLLDRVRPWIDGDPGTAVIDASLHRWKFALPTTILPEPLVAVSQAPPIACCGDAFAGPRVEGAASSGLAAGRWLARCLGAGPVVTGGEEP